MKRLAALLVFLSLSAPALADECDGTPIAAPTPITPIVAPPTTTRFSSAFDYTCPPLPTVADVTPDAIDWPNWGQLSLSSPVYSATRTFTGIDTTIQVSLQHDCAYPATIRYILNGGSPTAMTEYTPTVLNISSGDTLQFSRQGNTLCSGGVIPITITNNSDNDTIIDTVTSSGGAAPI